MSKLKHFFKTKWYKNLIYICSIVTLTLIEAVLIKHYAKLVKETFYISPYIYL